MKIEFTELLKHRPFQIAWVWEMLCIGVALYCVLALENEPLGIGIIFAGVAPMAAVMLLFVQAKKKALAAPDRSKDLVQ